MVFQRWGVSEVVEHLSSKCEALRSNPNTTKKKTKGREERREGRKGGKERKKERKSFLIEFYSP
jgi:hypothetical protein